MPTIKNKKGDTLHTDADLRSADLREADFPDDHDLQNEDLEGAYIFKCNGRGMQFNGANLTGVVLDEADLTGANFSDANLYDTDFFDAILTGADFRGAKNIERAAFQGATWDGTTQWPDGFTP